MKTQTTGFNQGAPDLPTESVKVPELPCLEALRVTASGAGVLKSPKAATALYTRKQTKIRITKKPRKK